MLKRVAITSGIFLTVVLVTAFSIFTYRGWRAFRASLPPKMPENFKNARVVVGDSFLSKKNLHEGLGIDVITDIQLNGALLTAAGRSGAAVVSKNGELLKEIHFDKCDSDVTVTASGFLCRGSWSTDVRMVDSDGKALWSYSGGTNGIDDAAEGTLGGQPRIAVGLNGGGGVRLLGVDGKELWKQDDGNVWHVEIVSESPSSQSVILHSNARGEITQRDQWGKVLARYRPEVYLAHFSRTAWGEDPSRNKLIASDGDSTYVLTTTGKTLAKLPASDAVAVQAQASGTPVQLEKGKVYYASLLRYELWDRSVLYVYSPANKLVYEEINDQDCGALYALPREHGAEDLILGCDGHLRKYSTRDSMAQ